MTLSAARKNGRMLVLLRDAILSSHTWEDMNASIEAAGISVKDIRTALPPHIDFDPHMHTVYSDGQFTPKQLVWWARAAGLKAIGITDHDNITPALGEAIEEGERLGITVVPGLEYTVNRLGGQSWKGLEVGLHFFPSDRFAAFLKTAEGQTFCQTYAQMAEVKSRQGWGALERTNAELIVPNGITSIEREELWKASGETSPVCPSTVTLLVLSRLFDEKPEMLEEFPNTRVVYSYMHTHNLIPPSEAKPQDFDGVRQIRNELGRHDIQTTLTLNHPEEWMSKSGLRLPDGTPDLPGMRRLVLLMMLHAPEELPVTFYECHTARNTPESRRVFGQLFQEIENIRAECFPQIPALGRLASTDSHRVSGFIDARGELQAWVPGEDFIWGLGAIDEHNPRGSLEVPPGYPDAQTALRVMREAAH